MNHCRNVIAFFLILILTCAGGLHAAESTREGGLSNTIVIFRDGVPWEEVDSYALEWESRGTTRIMDLPMINGIVLDVPWEVTPAELADDSRVAIVENDQRMRWRGAASSDGNSFIISLRRI